MLNTHQLNVFLISAETLNFSETARKLHLTQSNVSQHIKALEAQLDVELFARRGRSIELTIEGEALVPLAREVVEGSMRAQERMEMFKSSVNGHLIVGCNTAPGKYLLPALLARFTEKYPMVRIACQVVKHQHAIQGLADGSIQFALTNLGEEPIPSSSEFHLYLKEPILLVVHPDHPWAERGEIEPHELEEEIFILREPGSGTYANVQAALKTVGVDILKLKTNLEMGTSEAVAVAVQQGLGVGFVSQMIAEKICRGEVVPVKIAGVEILQDIYFGRQTFLPATGAEAAFWDFINEYSGEVFQQALRIQSVEMALEMA